MYTDELNSPISDVHSHPPSLGYFSLPTFIQLIHTQSGILMPVFFSILRIAMYLTIGGGGETSDLVDLVCLGHDHAVPLDNHSIRVDTALK